MWIIILTITYCIKLILTLSGVSKTKTAIKKKIPAVHPPKYKAVTPSKDNNAGDIFSFLFIFCSPLRLLSLFGHYYYSILTDYVQVFFDHLSHIFGFFHDLFDVFSQIYHRKPGYSPKEAHKQVRLHYRTAIMRARFRIAWAASSYS